MKRISILFLALHILATYGQQPVRGPDFLIIGAQKAGTTALYKYLIEHPAIKPATLPQLIIHPKHPYKNKPFNTSFDIEWYKAQFPQKKDDECWLTGEASQYINVPHAHEVFHHYFPNIKLIFILKNPVQRALSQYKHNLRIKAREWRTFEKAIQDEVAAFESYFNNIYFKDTYYNPWGYLTQGLYINHLKRWLTYFPKEHFLIILSDDLLNNTAATVNNVFRFLGLPEYTLPSYPKHNVATNNWVKMKPETEEMLIELFRPFNQELQNLLTNELDLDITLNWNL